MTTGEEDGINVDCGDDNAVDVDVDAADDGEDDDDKVVVDDNKGGRTFKKLKWL